MYVVIHCLLLVVRFISMLNIDFHENNINYMKIYCVWCIGQHIMRYSNIIVINNYAILHIISIIMRLCMIKHPGTHASTVSTPTTTNERLPAQQKERLPRNRNSTVYRGWIRNTTFLLYESTSLGMSQGLTLARCCFQTRGLSRGIKIVMDSHTILLMLVLNMMFLYMYVYFVDAL